MGGRFEPDSPPLGHRAASLAEEMRSGEMHSGKTMFKGGEVLIDDLRVEDDGDIRRFVATVSWEDVKRPPFNVEYGIEKRDAPRAELNIDSFIIPAAVVAMHDGEQRVLGSGPICPVLHSGLTSSLQWLARWNRGTLTPPRIDSRIGCEHPVAPSTGMSAVFLSGGIDSMALLANNHALHPPGDPLRFSIGLIVVGIQKHRWTQSDAVRDRLAAARLDLDSVAAMTDIEIVPVATNLRTLVPSSSFWKYEYQGAALAGVGHLFSKSISNLAIASTWRISHLDEWGSHPLLDVGYGTHSLRIWHELAHLGRLQKTAVVAERPELLQELSVCNERDGGNENCGRCEKCVRTMLAFEALGLDPAPIFQRSGVQAEELKAIQISSRGLEDEYAELINPLEERGRSDLATAIRRRIRTSRITRSPIIANGRNHLRKLRSIGRPQDPTQLAGLVAGLLAAGGASLKAANRTSDAKPTLGEARPEDREPRSSDQGR